MQPSFSPCLRDRQNFFRSHGVRAGLARIASEGAVAAIIAAKIGQRKKDFARVSDDAGAVLFFQSPRRGQQLRKKFVIAAQELASHFRRQRLAIPHLAQARGQRVGCECLRGSWYRMYGVGGSH